MVKLIATAAKLCGYAAIFFAGVRASSFVTRMESNVLNTGLTYSENSAKTPLGVVDKENKYGNLEKVLVNLSTEEVIYRINPDYLPDNNLIYEGLEKRTASMEKSELPELYAQTKRLENQIAQKLYADVPVSSSSADPSLLEISAIPNFKGELQAVLRYGDRAVFIGNDDFDYMAKNGREIALESGVLPKEVPGNEGSNTLLYAAVVGLATLAGGAYKKARENYPA